MAQHRDNCFDFLRFLFAFIVVLNHMAVVTQIAEWQALEPFFNTYISITGFFVISGFLITQSYIRSSSVKSYFSKRAKRLLPAYWIVVLGCAFGLVLLSEYSLTAYFTNPQWCKYLFANLSFLNFLQPCLPGVFTDAPWDCAVNGALWTLKIEVAFYLCVPLIIWLLRKTNKPWIILVIIYILSILYRNGLHWYADYTHQHTYRVLARQLPGFLSYFAVGIGGYLYKEMFLKHRHKFILPAIIIAILEWVLGIEILLPFAFGIIVLWCAHSLSALNNFARYGDISYGIYIYHFPLIQILLAVGFFHTLNIWIAGIIVILMIVTISLLSWHYVEKRTLQRNI